MKYPLIPIGFRVMFMWPPVENRTSIFIDNFYGHWSLYGPAMYPSNLEKI